MEYNEQYTDMINRMAAAAYPPDEIAFALGIDKNVFSTWIKDIEHPVSVAFYTGLMSSELAVRESVFQLARNASSPAQTMAMKIFDETRKTLKREGYSED